VCVCVCVCVCEYFNYNYMSLYNFASKFYKYIIENNNNK